MTSFVVGFGRVARAIQNRVWPRISTLIRLWDIRLRALRNGLPPLPPGRLFVDDHRFWRDDLFLIHEARRFGPVFKTNISGQFVTCIVDHKRSRAILNENVARLGAPDTPYNQLVPGDFLRCQTGEVHRNTRRLFVRALRDDLVGVHTVALRAIVQRELDSFASAGEALSLSADKFLRTLDRIATTMLLLIFFGVRRGDLAFTALTDGYARLGPKGFVWEIGPAEKQAAADLYAVSYELISELRRSADGPPSVLLELVAGKASAPITDNIVGNLVYMVEMGRYDLYSLFHWITKYLADHPAVVAAIRAEEPPAGSSRVSLSAAAVLETLRLNQSEAVIRQVLKNITFDGWGIPKGGFLRACMREGHRNPAVFPHPERFNPQRFLGREFGPDEYSPFGFDHHHCIASDLVVRLGSILIEELVRGFNWRVLADGPTERGPYHWLPSSAFAIRVTPRCQ